MAAQLGEIAKEADGLSLHGIFNGHRVDFKTLKAESLKLDFAIKSLGDQPSLLDLMALETDLSDYLVRCRYFLESNQVLNSARETLKQDVRDQSSAIKSDFINIVISCFEHETDAYQQSVLFQLFPRPTEIRRKIYASILGKAEEGDAASIDLITSFNRVILTESAEHALSLFEEIRGLKIRLGLLVSGSEYPLQLEAQKGHQKTQGQTLTLQSAQSRGFQETEQRLNEILSAYNQLYEIVRNISSSDQQQLNVASELLEIFNRFMWFVDGLKKQCSRNQSNAHVEFDKADLEKLHQVILDRFITEAQSVSAKIRIFTKRVTPTMIQLEALENRCSQLHFELAQVRFTNKAQEASAHNLSTILAHKLPRLIAESKDSLSDKGQTAGKKQRVSEHLHPGKENSSTVVNML